ncbi:MAG: diaminopimelate epimerase [Desertimonas sp.]
MTIRLTKHHAFGNDFLVTFADIDDPDAPALARRWCDRRRGVGADGLLIAREADGVDAVMVLFNADGSRAEMSGNGIRCFAQAVAARRPVALDELRILTDAGERLVTMHPTQAPDTIEASVDMGAVEPIDPPAGWAALGTHPDRPVAHLSVGNPHAVVGVDEVAAVDLVALGTKVPQVNLEIVEPGPEPGAVTMRVHERGAGITAACGTGACAVAWAAAKWGLVGAGTEELVVHMDGGSASVTLNRPAPGHVTLRGPATFIATVDVITS